MGRQIGSHLKGWSRACKVAGLEGLQFHDLRRSAIRQMERDHIPRHVGMGFSGHRTESVYRRYDIVVEAESPRCCTEIGRIPSATGTETSNGRSENCFPAHPVKSKL